MFQWKVGIVMAKMKKSKLVGTILSATGIILAVTIGIVANVIVFSSQYSATIEAALGDTGRRYTSVTYDGVDPTYYNKDYETKADREKYRVLWEKGPGGEGGDGGGTVVTQGTPEEVSKVEASYTGHYLKQVLADAVAKGQLS